MKPDPEWLKSMFKKAGIDREKFIGAISLMARKWLHTSKQRKEWTPENPTRNFCYITSDFLFWYVAPRGSAMWGLKVPNDDNLHRFVKWPDKTIVDLTCDQFEDFSALDYSKAFQKPPMQAYNVGHRGPSIRAKVLAMLLGFDQDGWDEQALGKRPDRGKARPNLGSARRSSAGRQ